MAQAKEVGLPTQPQVPPIMSPGPGLKVAICIPSTPLVDIRWALALPQILSSAPVGSTFFAQWRYGVAESREQLYLDALAQVPDLTHLLFVDTDMLPNPDCLKLLIEDNKPIVSAAYFNSLYTGAAAWRDEGALRVSYMNGQFVNMFTGKTCDPVQECDKVGMGFCLWKKEVFTETLKDEEKPIFYYKVDGNMAKMLSEDFYAFEKLRKYGVKPFVDFRAQAIHLKSFFVNYDGNIQVPVVQPQPQPQPQQQLVRGV